MKPDAVHAAQDGYSVWALIRDEELVEAASYTAIEGHMAF